MIKVAKFGGTSLSDENQFKKVRDIIKHDKSIKYVVASAPGSNNKQKNKITDLLYLCYKNKKNNISYIQEFDEITKRFCEIVDSLNICVDIKQEIDKIKLELESNCSEDYFVSRGEYLNSIILAKYIDFSFVDAKDIIFFNEDEFLDEEKTYKNVYEKLGIYKNAVIPGFYGSTFDEKIKTFSRGGSDITGSIIAKGINADIYENWTDVSGLLMADPKIINNPKKIDIITYRELRELSYMGATVLHDEAVFPVREASIPINIRNTNQPLNCGTLIVEKIEDSDDEGIITGISGKKDYTVFKINKANMAKQIGIIMQAMNVFFKRKIVVEHIPTGIDTFSIVVLSDTIINQKEKIILELENSCKADNISAFSDISLITIVGRNVKNKSKVFRRLFSALEKENIEIKIIGQGLSEMNLIIGINNDDFEKTIKAIYYEFSK